MKKLLFGFVFLMVASVAVSCGSDDGSNANGDDAFEAKGLYGKITDASTGKPIANAEIALFSDDGDCLHTESNTDGMFAFNKADAGTYKAYITARGYAALPHKYSNPADIEYGGGDEEFDFSLPPLALSSKQPNLGGIKVSVKDIQDETPLACAFMTAEGHGDYSTGFCITNKQGECQIYNLTPGLYSVRGYKPTTTIRRTDDIQVEEDETAVFDTTSMSGYVGNAEISYTFNDPLSPTDIETQVFLPRLLIPLPQFGASVSASSSAIISGIPVGTFAFLPKPQSDGICVDEHQDFYIAQIQIKRDETKTANIPLSFGLRILDPKPDSVHNAPSKDNPLQISWDEMPGVDVYGIEIRNPFTGRNVVGGFGNKHMPYTSSQTNRYTFSPDEGTDSLQPGLYQIIITAMKREQNGNYTTLYTSEADGGFFIIK